MSRLILFLAAASLAACSSASPVTPAPASEAPGAVDARIAPVPGTYALTFNTYSNGGYQEVSTLEVSSQELILKAYVTDSSGAPATRGNVTFEYCSYGGQKNNIERADEAPKEACADGTASWVRLNSVSVAGGTCPTLGTGYACHNFGIVRIPRTVGFRVKYEPKGSSIAAGTSVPADFTWVEAS